MKISLGGRGGDHCYSSKAIPTFVQLPRTSAYYQEEVLVRHVSNWHVSLYGSAVQSAGLPTSPFAGYQ